MKKFTALVVAFVLCLSLGITVMATESPDANDDEDTKNNHTSPDSDDSSITDSQSPVTGDTWVVPGLGIVALAGITVSAVAKKKEE